MKFRSMFVALLLATACHTNAPMPASAEVADSLAVKSIVSDNTQEPGVLETVSEVSGNITVPLEQGHSVKVLTATQQHTPTYIFNRSDGIQFVTVHQPGSRSTSHYEFQGMELLPLSDGSVLVNSSETGETHFYIEPAWARDLEGNIVNTFFEVNGTSLIQVVDGSQATEPIVADPYIRDVRNAGRKVGQEMVFSSKETSFIASGGAFVCAGLAGWYAIGCAAAPAVASYALSRNNCLAIRALGSYQAPNLIFPVSARC